MFVAQISDTRNAIRSDSRAIRVIRFQSVSKMNPRLVAIEGLLKGQVITLMANTSIGRGSSNQIAISVRRFRGGIV